MQSDDEFDPGIQSFYSSEEVISDFSKGIHKEGAKNGENSREKLQGGNY